MLAECFMYINSSYPKHTGFLQRESKSSYIFGRHAQFLVNTGWCSCSFLILQPESLKLVARSHTYPEGWGYSKVHTYLSFCPIQKSYMHQKPCKPLGKILSCHLFHQMVSIWKFLLSALHSGLTMLPMYFTYEDCQLLLCSQPFHLISSVLKPTNWMQCNGDFDRDVMESPREPGYWRVRSLLRGETEAWTQ